MTDRQIDETEDTDATSGLAGGMSTSRLFGLRKGGCIGCAGAFIILCMLAAAGSYFTRTTGTSPAPGSTGAPGPVGATPTPTPSNVQPSPTSHVLPKTVSGITRTLAPTIKQRFERECREKDVAWPPQRVRLVCLKMERQLELWAANANGQFQFLKKYPVLAASGELGPKRREGDLQVPEGKYRLVYLNPKSRYHLSLLLDYPNAADRAREANSIGDGESLGGDICVHGSNQSIGCIAIGDAAIEEVFTLAAMADSENRDIIIMPADLRKRPDLISLAGDDSKVVKLYKRLADLATTMQ